jgi:uncharacterized protein (TIGR02246 family)
MTGRATMGTRFTRVGSPGFFFVMLVLLAPAVTFGGPAEEASAVIDRWVTVFNANDVDAVVKLYAPDATLLGTISPILAEGPGPINAYFSSLRGSGNKVAIGERRMMALGESAVLTTGFYEFTPIRDGKPVSIPARFTFVVAKRGGDWLIVHHHSSQRPKPPQ